MSLFDPPFGHLATYQIRTYEVDQRKYLTVPALVKLLHEAAMENVMRLGLSVFDLEHLKVGWVLLKQFLQVERYPRLGEKIQVITYPAQWDRIFAYRDFWIYDEQEVLIASSATTWVLMNMETRRLTPIPDFIKAKVEPWEPPQGLLPVITEKLLPLAQPEVEYPHRVGWYEMDWNGHLNNSLYIYWMLNALPAHLLANHQLAELSVQFKSEGKLEDQLYAGISAAGTSEWRHQLRNEQGAVLSTARSVWRPH
jgi:medium-chain acyl-[acyl-carrier-protein] hydrolase